MSEKRVNILSDSSSEGGSKGDRRGQPAQKRRNTPGEKTGFAGKYATPQSRKPVRMSEGMAALFEASNGHTKPPMTPPDAVKDEGDEVVFLGGRACLKYSGVMSTPANKGASLFVEIESPSAPIPKSKNVATPTPKSTAHTQLSSPIRFSASKHGILTPGTNSSTPISSIIGSPEQSQEIDHLQSQVSQLKTQINSLQQGNADHASDADAQYPLTEFQKRSSYGKEQRFFLNGKFEVLLEKHQFPDSRADVLALKEAVDQYVQMASAREKEVKRSLLKAQKERDIAVEVRERIAEDLEELQKCAHGVDVENKELKERMKELGEKLEQAGGELQRVKSDIAVIQEERGELGTHKRLLQELFGHEAPNPILSGDELQHQLRTLHVQLLNREQDLAKVQDERDRLLRKLERIEADKKKREEAVREMQRDPYQRSAALHELQHTVAKANLKRKDKAVSMGL